MCLFFLNEKNEKSHYIIQIEYNSYNIYGNDAEIRNIAKKYNINEFGTDYLFRNCEGIRVLYFKETVKANCITFINDIPKEYKINVYSVSNKDKIWSLIL
jgi:hypothetical protein